MIALHLAMCDMMQTLTLYVCLHASLSKSHSAAKPRLKQVTNVNERGPDGFSVEDRLKQRLGAVIDTIKLCAKLCDSYYSHSDSHALLIAEFLVVCPKSP